ncbi:MAG TPA: hypothetical protein VKZ53_13815 [Candidatus Angelobacter sp.]|nr:hypothetical protein [Candidatus Angelobacter sp.]
MLPFGLILLLNLVSPQNSPEVPTAEPKASPKTQQFALRQPYGVCYTMRSYFFKREDGKAPTLVGETTCTKVQPRTERTSPAPARLIPALMK